MLPAEGLAFWRWEPYQIGILLGTITYFTAVIVVFILLIAGGSFRRIKEQAEAFEKNGRRALQAPLSTKPRLFDNLLESMKTLPRRPEIPDGVLQGLFVELRPLKLGDEKADMVAKQLFEAGNGTARYGHNSYDEIEKVWRWLPEGPFESVEEMQQALNSRSTERRQDMYITDKPSGYVIGAVSILENTPECLRAEIGDLWITPAFRGTYASAEVCQLLLKHLFSIGYRRVEWRQDADNICGRKLALALGFVLEGVLRKHMVLREANRDTALLALTNSDWREGAEKKAQALLKARANKGQVGAVTVSRSLLTMLEDLAKEKEE